MKNRKYVIILFLSYIGVLALCAWLTFTSRQDFDVISMVINGVMLLLVAVIYINAGKRFTIAVEIEKEFVLANKRINEDYNAKSVYLWDDYKDITEGGIFERGILAEPYKAYQKEMKRLEFISKDGYRCSIEDFINKELIDTLIHRNVLNLIPGVMTGLGILGTFVGLSFGLQNFNTGTATEISESIAPLMNGIKVAFHTSIFGMLFSLSFNYVYKAMQEHTYAKLQEFLKLFSWYVISDSDNNYYNSMQKMMDNLPEMIGDKISQALLPYFDKMSETLENFTHHMADNQLEGVGEIVDRFMEEMNQSLGGNFEHLGDVIEQTCELQKQNSSYMQNVLEKIGDMASNIQDINELSGRTVESLSSYISEIEKLQAIINESFMSVNMQLEASREQEEKMRGYVETLINYERQISEASGKFTRDMTEQLALLSKLEGEMSERTKANLEMLACKAEEYANSLAETAKQQINAIIALSNNRTADMNLAAQELARVSQQLNGQLANSLTMTFDVFDKNLAEISQHLSGTIAEVDSTTGRVPQVVVAAYDGMEKAFMEMQDKLEGLIHAMDIMERNIPKIISRLDKDN